MATVDEVCGLPGERAALCEPIFDLTASTWSNEIADLIGTAFRVAVVVAVAVLVNQVLRYFIRRSVRRLSRPETRDSLSKVRRRTGLAFLDTTSVEIPAARRVQRAETIELVLRSLGTLVVWTLAFIWILEIVGVALGPLIAGAGIAGVALGFGAQSMVKDFLAGVFILLEDQYGVGDVVDLGDGVGSNGVTGTVESVTLRMTRIRDVEGVVWYVPNGEIRRAGNMSQQWSRAVLDIEIARSADVERATEVIERVAHDMWSEERWKTLILASPEVWGVEEVGPLAVKVRLVVKTLPLEQWKVARELRVRIKVAFDEEGIEIPPVPLAPPPA